ncbi:MAG TPA: ADP-ribosylglycohydrolase family protein [Bacteroidales bacterium]|nr:ADP-ribosylglycohydrolase family protein [Bacteroidales bacterium]
MKRSGSHLLLFLIALSFYSCNKVNTVFLNEVEFRDKVYACWLGKNIGGTLGMPFEGDTATRDITFYTNIREGEPAPNDDLDLQLLWLKVMQENEAHTDAFRLGKYWLKYVPVDWNEYGVGKANMKAGFMPPVSGEFNNEKWKNSNGAWIRSEIWACLYPCNPLNAAKMAREDACVDHGMAEGMFAEIFTASVESAAFVVPDRDSLISFGLSMIPSDCRVAKAVRCAVKAKKSGKDWKQAREEVVKNTIDLGWFQAPRNVAFTMIGWLYGDGDFGKSLCIAVNCGDDTDCTGATLGSILGIIGGTKAIPENWRRPVGNKITNVAINGFTSPPTLDILTDSTISMARRVRDRNNFKVIIGKGRTDTRLAREFLTTDRTALEKVWHYSPWKVVRHNHNWVITLDYHEEPYILPGTARKLTLSVSNVSDKAAIFNYGISGLPAGWIASGFPSDTVSIDKGGRRVTEFSIEAKAEVPDTAKMTFVLSLGGERDSVPFTLLTRKANRK